jgi:subtilisin family serine protease
MAMAGVDGVLEEIGRQGRELIQLLKLTPGVSVERAVQALQSLAGVVYAEPNYIARAAYTPSDPDYQPEQWGLHNTGQTIDGQAGTSDADIDGPEAWDIERGQSNPVTVAVIDTGIDLGHPDLSGKIGGGYNWAGITQSRYYYYDYSYTPPQRYTTARYFGYSSSTLKRAQSITGTGQPLDHVGFFLQKTGSPTGNITVSLRSARDGMSLASYTITPAEVSVIRSEIYKQLSPAVTLTSGSTYYLVLETANNDSTNYYYLYDNWGTSNPSTDQYDPYRDGQESRWDGSVWVEYPNDDLYFRTNPNAAPRDDNGHGTHVGGIIGAEANNGNGGVGVSFGAHLMPLKALDCTGSGPYSDIISAIYYAADNGAGVINMSLGGPSSSSALQDAVSYAHGKGVAIFAAAGNDGNTTIDYPAGCGNVMGVGATTNQDLKADFSNYNSSVDISAPGWYVYSTMPTYPVALNGWGYAQDYDYLSGTSMAAPMASGLAALVRSAKPGYTPGQVEQVMEDFADDLGAAGRDDYFGYGRINAFRTLEKMPAFPYIDHLSPSSTAVGEKVTIYGTAFGSGGAGSYVSFDGVQATRYDIWGDTTIECRVPPGISGQVQVTVTTPGGTSNGLPFTVKAPPPMTTWYLAEGATAGGFETWVLVQNPGDAAVDIDMRLQTESGEVPGPRDTIPARTRRSYNLEKYVNTYNVSTKVTSSGGGVVCERAMYGGNRAWGHDSIGVTSPATTWYLAEGATAGGFETWVLVQNPGDAAASVGLTYMTPGGTVPGPHLDIPANTRFSVNVSDLVPNDYNVSTVVISDRPVVAERAMYWGGRTGGSDSIGCAP